MASPSTCLFDVGGGACGTPRRPRTGALRGAFEVSATLADGRATSMRLREAFAGSRLPDSLDVSALSDGPHALCVASAGGSDCVTFTHLGEQTLVIQQPSGSTAPVANAGQGASAECASSSATPVTLDGSASTGAIVRYEWFENYGTASERSLGEGVVLQTTLPLGFHTITLKVTDPVGQTATAETERAIIDSIAPVVSFTTNPVSLWPADHRMVGVTVTPIVTDACSSPPLRLLSVTSNEPDDAPGDADGSTVGDVRGRAGHGRPRLPAARRDRTCFRRTAVLDRLHGGRWSGEHGGRSEGRRRAGAPEAVRPRGRCRAGHLVAATLIP